MPGFFMSNILTLDMYTGYNRDTCKNESKDGFYFHLFHQHRGTSNIPKILYAKQMGVLPTTGTSFSNNRVQYIMFTPSPFLFLTTIMCILL
jgi:hypothetical protein